MTPTFLGFLPNSLLKSSFLFFISLFLMLFFKCWPFLEPRQGFLVLILPILWLISLTQISSNNLYRWTAANQFLSFQSASWAADACNIPDSWTSPSVDILHIFQVQPWNVSSSLLWIAPHLFTHLPYFEFWKQSFLNLALYSLSITKIYRLCLLPLLLKCIHFFFVAMLSFCSTPPSPSASLLNGFCFLFKQFYTIATDIRKYKHPYHSTTMSFSWPAFKIL